MTPRKTWPSKPNHASPRPDQISTSPRARSNGSSNGQPNGSSNGHTERNGSSSTSSTSSAVAPPPSTSRSDSSGAGSGRSHSKPPESTPRNGKPKDKPNDGKPNDSPVLPRTSRLVRVLCALTTALLWWLAVSQPWGFVLGWVALAPVLWAARELSPRKSLGYGWASGVAAFFLINWWIIPTIANGAPSIGLPAFLGAPLGALAVSLIAIIHGWQVGISLWLAQKARARTGALGGPWAFALVFAFCWGVSEWARTIPPLAHSWGAMAFSQWGDLPLLQNVRWMGQHGMSAFCAFISACLALGWEERGRSALSTSSGSKPPSSTWGQSSKALWGVPAVALILLHIGGAWRLWANPMSAASDKVKVLLVQTNVPTNHKDLPEPPVDSALRLSDSFFNLHPNGEKPDLVVWPETVLSGHIGRAPGSAVEAGRVEGLEADRVREWTSRRGVPILVGSTLKDTQDGKRVARNDAVWFAPDGSIQKRGKTRPVPFGERAPLSEWMPFLTTFAPSPMIEPAKIQGPMTVRLRDSAMAIGTVICFESAFSHPAIDAAKGARALFVLTNDEWFGTTEAPTQHAAMGVLRAVECGVPLAQAANGGHSFAVDRFGRFVQGRSTLTPEEEVVRLGPRGREAVVEVDLPLAP